MGKNGDMYCRVKPDRAEDIWYPLPQRQIDLMGGLIVKTDNIVVKNLS